LCIRWQVLSRWGILFCFDALRGKIRADKIV
jgi:hypothetical protein